MSKNDRYKGADIPIQLTLKDDAGTPIDIASLDAVVAIVYYADNRDVLAKFNTAVVAGYEPIETIDGPNGVIEIKLQSDVTTGARDGDIRLEVKTQATDAEYDDSRFHSVERDIFLFTMNHSISAGYADLTS